RKLPPCFAPGRLKHWLTLLTRNYPEATALFAAIRREDDCGKIDWLLGMSNFLPTHQAAEHEAFAERIAA
ncbi:MAG: hypothetical protein ACRETW_02300, partial [Stenotrophobium sp.]